MTLGSITPRTIVSDAAQVYLDWLSVKVAIGRFSPSTLAGRRWGLSLLDSVESLPLGQIALGDLRRSQVIEWTDALAAGESKSAEFNALRALQALIKWCADRDTVSWAVVARIGHGYRPPPGRALSWDELVALRNVIAGASQTTDVQIIRVVADTGARTYEVRLARVEHYDSHERVLRWPAGKNGRPRIVVLSPVADAIVRLRLGGTGLLFPSETIFRHKGPSGPVSHRHLNALLVRLATVAGIREPDKLTMHDLRHTFATLAYERGMSIEDIASALSHSSTTTTRRYYLHNAVHPGARRVSASLNPEAA